MSVKYVEQEYLPNCAFLPIQPNPTASLSVTPLVENITSLVPTDDVAQEIGLWVFRGP